MRLSPLLVVLAVAGCNEGTPPSKPATPESGLKNAPAPGTSEVDRPHVVFTREVITLDRLGVPVEAPVSTPSRPSQETIRSDDPTVVAIDQGGRLVALRAGTTTVRAVASASSMTVKVVGGEAFKITPALVELRSGGETTFSVKTSEGEPIPPSALRWKIAQGTPVAVVNERVMSLGGTGRFDLEAALGDVILKLPVVVGVAGSDRVVVSPARARVRAGQVAKFRVFGGQGDLRADWTTSEPKVLASLGDGLFQALRSGKARVCAAALERSSCSDVEVKP